MSARFANSSLGQEEEAGDQKKEINSPYAGQKRSNYITWEDYFMGIALLAAQRSKDPSTQVGCVIVNDENKILGVGYNGMPTGCSDDEFPWEKNKDFLLQCKLTYVCHAEMNAFMNAVPRDTKGCKLYVTLFPCNECAKIIIQAGIKEVIYKNVRSNDQTAASKRMFNAVGINYRPFKPTSDKITLCLGGGSASQEESSSPKKRRAEF